VKKLFVTLLKIGLSVAILGYLVYDATSNPEQGNAFVQLRDGPKQWGWLTGALGCCALAVLLTFLRWWLLIRALDFPCSLRNSIRISVWGYLFNLSPLGLVGGDLVKTVMLAHDHRPMRAKALASVIVDRVIGLYILFVVVSAAIVLTEFRRLPSPELRWIGNLTFIITGVSTAGLIVAFGPNRAIDLMIRSVGRIPRVGIHLEHLIDAIRMYNRKPVALAAAMMLTVGVHLSFAVGCYMIARGLFENYLTLAEHLVVMPLSSAMGVIPLPAGPMEGALEYLYMAVSAVGAETGGAVVAKGQGLVVALAYRLITILIALLGVFFYFGNRREMADVMHEAEQEEQEEPA